MSTRNQGIPQALTALKVTQWLSSWDKVRFDPSQAQAEPEKKSFYLCSMKASHLKALTGVYRRSTKGGKPRSLDPNVQRGHEENRSATIREFVQYGFPWCELSDARRKGSEADDLRKPGWLPTAILVNILLPQSIRNGVEISDTDLMRIEDDTQTAIIHLPKGFSGANWKPQKVFPLEVIDGQHRLWAFEDFNPGDDFELPVVAFYGLDLGWQAYLFWSVNITPKKINRSLAFDLYPLLRQQSWLDKFEGHPIYRETRCQELVEALWSHPDSPWYQRINMLGETKGQREYQGPSATQAAWVRSLFTTFVKQWEGKGTKIGGLFGAPPATNQPLLSWNRAMQAAVLVYAGKALKEHVKQTKAKWAEHLRALQEPQLVKGDDSAFYGQYSLISTDQGIRGFLFIVNDLCFTQSQKLHLMEWQWEDFAMQRSLRTPSATEEESVTAAIKSFAKTNIAQFIDAIAQGLATYDWRTSSTPNLTDEERLRQSVFRGSSGYSEMRRQLLKHLTSQQGPVGIAAATVLKVIGRK